MDGEKLFYKDLDSESKSKQILLETFTTKFRTNYIQCEGFVFPESFKDFGDQIRTMEIRDDDIWVCTFPKSGTTWTQEMLWCIVNGVDHKDAKKCITERFLFLEISALFNNCKDLSLPENSIEDVEKLSSPRLIKTHLPFNLLPEKLKSFSTNAKIIHVARNPRDTLISYYHHCRLLEGYKGSFPQFVELFFKGAVSYGPLPTHLQGYLVHGKNPKILFLNYEEMQQDLKSVIYKTADFIGKSITENEVVKLLDHLSFSNMKHNPASNYEKFVEVRRKLCLTDNDERHFIRRGIVGEWKEQLDSELYERCLKWEAENLNGFKFTFSL